MTERTCTARHRWRTLWGATLLFTLGSGPAWADDLDIDRAEWRADSGELRVEGNGRDDRTVTVTNASNASQVIGSDRVDDDEWEVRVTGPNPVPCVVRATQSDGRTLTRVVSNAPANCDLTAGGNDNDDGGGDFRITRARWDSGDRRIEVEGDGTRDRTVTVRNAFQLAQVLGTDQVEDDGDWRVRRSSPSPIPCRVRARQSDGQIAEMNVANAPSTCAPKANNPPPVVTPSISINNVTVTEGATANFAVTLSAASTQTVTVVASTANGSAVAPGDFTARSNVTLTFPAGSTSQTFAVTTINDTVAEQAETFNVNLTNAVNATIADNQGVGTISINDQPVAQNPTLSIANLSQNEGNSGTSTMTFTVRLSAAAPAGGVSFNFATANGTATAGTTGAADYVATSGSRTIAAGATTATIPVTLRGDTTSHFIRRLCAMSCCCCWSNRTAANS